MTLGTGPDGRKIYDRLLEWKNRAKGLKDIEIICADDGLGKSKVRHWICPTFLVYYAAS